MELNKIYCENNLDTMARMPDNFVDLTVTSPPYDNLRNYNGFSFEFEKVAKELYRVTKDGGVVVWVVGDSTINGGESLSSCKQKIFFIEQCGFKIYDTMIFEKTGNGSPQNPFVRYSPCFEYMIVLSKGIPKAFNAIMVYSERQGRQKKSKRQRNGTMNIGFYNAGVGCPKSNIWQYAGSSKSNDTLHFKHPAPFPEQLAADHIHSWSNKGDLIYDPFMGSGTTAKMAHLQQRNWVGSEISQEYVDLANKRIAPYLQQKQLF